MRAQFFIPVLAAAFLVFGAGSVRADASLEDGQKLTVGGLTVRANATR